MPEVKRGARKRSGAFSLLELLIVILLAGIIAWLVSGVYRHRLRSEKTLSVSRIRSLVLDPNATKRQLICIDRCRECFFEDSEGAMSAAGFALPPVQAYGVDGQGQTYRLQFGRYRDRPICLRFRGYADGHTSRMILESEERFYYLPAYFGETERFSTIEDAAARWTRNRDLLRSRGDYY